jgi:excisionase family DNA binding protein
MKTVAEVAKILGVNNSRVIQLIIDGRIEAKKFGAKNWMILDYSAALKRVAGRPCKPKK